MVNACGYWLADAPRRGDRRQRPLVVPLMLGHAYGSSFCNFLTSLPLLGINDSRIQDGAELAPEREARGVMSEIAFTAEAGDWSEALPIGNGLLGGMVFGCTGRERIQLNEDSLWSGGHGTGLSFVGYEHGTATGYRRTLDLDHALGRIAYTVAQHWRYTRDEEFLRSEYPLVRDAILFFVDYLVQDKQGRWLTGPSASPENCYASENGVSNLCMASAFGQAGVVLAIIIRSRDTEVRSIAWPPSSLRFLASPSLLSMALPSSARRPLWWPALPRELAGPSSVAPE